MCPKWDCVSPFKWNIRQQREVAETNSHPSTLTEFISDENSSLCGRITPSLAQCMPFCTCLSDNHDTSHLRSSVFEVPWPSIEMRQDVLLFLYFPVSTTNVSWFGCQTRFYTWWCSSLFWGFHSKAVFIIFVGILPSMVKNQTYFRKQCPNYTTILVVFKKQENKKTSFRILLTYATTLVNIQPRKRDFLKNMLCGEILLFIQYFFFYL